MTCTMTVSHDVDEMTDRNGSRQTRQIYSMNSIVVVWERSHEIKEMGGGIHDGSAIR